MKMNQNEFLQLVSGYQAGCSKSRNILFQFLCFKAKEIFRLGFRNSKLDWDEVFDVVIRKVEKLLEFEYERLKKETVLNYVQKSLHNTILDCYRRKSCRYVCFSNLEERVGEGDEGICISFEDTIADDCTADEMLLEKEYINVLQKGVSLLGKQQRLVMELLLFHGLSNEQVMDRLDMDPNQFHVVKSNGKTRLLGWLRKSGVR